jgi:hypothetical protein
MDIFQRQGRDVSSKSKKSCPKSPFDHQSEATKDRPKPFSWIGLRLGLASAAGSDTLDD